MDLLVNENCILTEKAKPRRDFSLNGEMNIEKPIDYAHSALCTVVRLAARLECR